LFTVSVYSPQSVMWFILVLKITNISLVMLTDLCNWISFRSESTQHFCETLMRDHYTLKHIISLPDREHAVLLVRTLLISCHNITQRRLNSIVHCFSTGGRTVTFPDSCLCYFIHVYTHRIWNI